MHHENQEVLKALADCAAACDHCATACLQEQDVKMLSRCISLDIDCAAICRTTAGFISRGSENSGQIISACIDLCNACAAECEKHTHMEHCRECAEACRKCAEACQGVSIVSHQGNGRA